MLRRSIAAATFLGFTLAACGSEPVTPETTGTTIEISGLYVKAPAAGRDVTGGGMTVTATGGDVRLVAVSSEAAERVELHTMEIEDDMMRMRQVDGFDIADGETLSLEPGGPHLMLFGFDQSLAAGDSAEMLFTFRGDDDQDITLNYSAEIKAIGED